MAASKNKAPTALSALLSLLDLERLEDNLFRGVSSGDGAKRVYGGQVLAQSLVAAQRTVTPEDVAGSSGKVGQPRQMHSLHSYFLLAGDPKIPIIYDVERVRDGGSFSTRRVKAIQHGRPLFVMSVSFQREEQSFDHQMAMPDVPGPESLPSQQELRKSIADSLPENMRSYLLRELPIDMRIVEVDRFRTRAKAKPVQHVWLKANGTLPEDVGLHHCVLAYASDFTLLDTALVAHGKLMFDNDVQLASLDHAIWVHRPFRADEWLLYAQDSPSASGARGFSRGSVFSRDGRLVASTVQEGLMRQRTTSFSIK